MSKVIIEASHEYIICTESIISSYDRKVLTRLYQPLIGSIAFSLYESLLSELEFDKTVTSQKHSFKSLLKLMGVGIDDFRLALSKLEGTSLIKSFYDKKENYFLFELLSPKSPYDFFESPLLESKLHKHLGDEEYQRTKQYFSFAKISKVDFEDVSDNFNDVYSFDPNAIFIGSTNQVGKKSGQIKMSFDQESFDLKLKELQIPKSSITKNDLENIIMYSTAYSISSVDMADIVARSLDSNGKIDLVKLKKITESKVIGSKNNIKQTITIKDTGSMKLNELIDFYNKTNSVQFLTMKNGGSPVVISENNIIVSLREIFKFSDGIINCLLDYVCSKTNGTLNKTYIETIASSMKRAGINDTYESYEYLHKKSAKIKDDNSSVKQDNNNIEESIRQLEEFRKKKQHE